MLGLGANKLEILYGLDVKNKVDWWNPRPGGTIKTDNALGLQCEVMANRGRIEAPEHRNQTEG